MSFGLIIIIYSTACTSGAFLRGSSGFFSSPNFPKSFPQNSNCIWNITVPMGYIIKITFLSFQLDGPFGPSEGDSGVACLTISGGPNDIRLCGHVIPPPVYSLGNSILVTFTSFWSQYSGFNASYRAITLERGRS